MWLVGTLVDGIAVTIYTNYFQNVPSSLKTFAYHILPNQLQRLYWVIPVYPSE